MRPKFTGSKHMALGSVTGKSKNGHRSSGSKYPYLAICIRNSGNEASLEKGKAYRVVKPLPNDPPHRIRVVDEENEDYLYLADWFVPIQVSPLARQSVLRAISAGA
jgi:hypothetical protein